MIHDVAVRGVPVLSEVAEATFAQPVAERHDVSASPAACHWGYLDRDLPAHLAVADGAELRVDAVSHHAGDAPDLTLDPELEALWAPSRPTNVVPGSTSSPGRSTSRASRPERPSPYASSR